MTPCHLKIGLLLGALTVLPMAHPAAADDQVPYKGEEAGTVVKGAFQFPFAHESAFAVGEATHLGRYTLAGNFTVDVRSGTATGVFTLTAANGDVLFLDMTGHAVPTDLTQTIATFTIFGGTGRFAGAVGGFVSVQQFASAVNLPASPNPYVAEIAGTISTPGANKK